MRSGRTAGLLEVDTRSPTAPPEAAGRPEYGVTGPNVGRVDGQAPTIGSPADHDKVAVSHGAMRAP